ncbi:MAG: hypothetical protein WD045_03385 [Pirellulaceae bacterium]
MWIGVVSDTHGNEKSTTEAVHMLRQFPIEPSTWILNPGALHRAKPHSLAVVDLEHWNIEILPLV